MSHHGMNKGLLVAVLALAGASAYAQAPAPQQALSRSAQDPQLQWGPCPPFMPAGCGLAVLHGDPTKPNADVFLRLPTNGVIPDHSHTSAERMVLVAGELHVTYQGQATVVLKPGQSSTVAFSTGINSRPLSTSKGHLSVTKELFEDGETQLRFLIESVPLGTKALRTSS